MYTDKSGGKNISSSLQADDKNDAVYQQALNLIKLEYAICPFEEKRPTGKIQSLAKVRQSPIHRKNVDFYFPAPQIALLTGNKLEAIDVDSKNDLKGNLNHNLLSAIECACPDIYDKLVIEKTPSGGLHIYYKCNQIGASTKLAQRRANSEERAKAERVTILIETRGEGGAIVASPSPGYVLIKGDFDEIAVITPEQRFFLLSICRSFDQIGTSKLSGIRKHQQSQADAPWTAFNKEHSWEWMRDELCEHGFLVVKETDEKLFLLRDGSTAKSSGSIWKESNILYLFSTSTEFDANTPYDAFGVYCQLRYDGNVHDCAKALSETGVGTWNYDEGEFYSINAKGRIQINFVAIDMWMHEMGLRKMRYSLSGYHLVQVIDQKVFITDVDRIKKTFGDYIKRTVPGKVLNTLLSQIARIFKSDGLITQLEELNENQFIRSTDKLAWLFFQNVALKITSDEIDLLNYQDLGGLVWERNIIKRDFTFHESDGDAYKFIRLICNDNSAKEWSFRCAIGYLMHAYKDPVEPKVIIINDEFYHGDETEPQGGTGKGLIIKFLRCFKTTLSIDGKRWDFNRTFAFQGITRETELVAFEDVYRGFDFEKLFSTITEGFVVEHKGKDEYRIPYEIAPKLMITTNYAIKGSSVSHTRRRYELEIFPYFSHSYRPIDHFKKRFFDDWDDLEWLRFDNCMILCLQEFLKSGLPEQIAVTLEKKRVIQETNDDFFKWIEDLYQTDQLPEKIRKEVFIGMFRSAYPDYERGKHEVTRSNFARWISRWCKYRSVKFDSSNKQHGHMVYSFTKQDRDTND